jgi:glycosyltransferase involved in cell wall biosynthesis
MQKDLQTSSQNLPISLVIIALNEQKNIERCILSAPFVSEVVVLDSGSTDDTVAIARKLGARVFVEPWRGFAKQKIRATQLAANDWVLSLDADEALSPELAEEIKKLNFSADVDAYAMPRLTYHLNQWMYHSGMHPDYQTRLFNRKKTNWKDVQVHEHIEAKNKQKLNNNILHWSFESVTHQIETINKYSSLRAVDFKNSGKKYSSLKMMTKIISKFFEAYIFKKGYRDGVPGLIVSVVSAFATFLRWAKLYEIETNEKNKK